MVKCRIGSIKGNPNTACSIEQNANNIFSKSQPWSPYLKSKFERGWIIEKRA